MSEVVPAMPGLWETFDRGRATEYLAELAEHWSGLNVPATRAPDAAQGLFAHFADLGPEARRAKFRQLAKAYREDPYAPKSVVKFLAESDLTKATSHAGRPAKTTGYADVPTEEERAALGEYGELKL